MNDLQIVATLGLLLIAGASFYLASLRLRRRRTPLDLRYIRGYDLMPYAIDESVESGRPMHFSFGASAVGGETTPAALAAAGLMYYLIRRLSFERNLPLITLSDPITLALGSDTLRRAYMARDNLEAYRWNTTTWYPQGERSLAFGAGAAAHSANMDVSSHVLLGAFGLEIAYLLESGRRRGQRLIANSTQLEGQAVAYVMADEKIIGEEIFVGDAYLNPSDVLSLSSLIAQDTLRWVVIILIIIGVIVNLGN